MSDDSNVFDIVVQRQKRCARRGHDYDEFVDGDTITYVCKNCALMVTVDAD